MGLSRYARNCGLERWTQGCPKVAKEGHRNKTSCKTQGKKAQAGKAARSFKKDGPRWGENGLGRARKPGDNPDSNQIPFRNGGRERNKSSRKATDGVAEPNR